MNKYLKELLDEQANKSPIDFNRIDANKFRKGFPKAFARGSYENYVTKVDIEMDLDFGKLAARIYRPLNVSRSLPALVYFHGGGFVIGSPTLSDSVCEGLSHCAQCVVISIDYRLAPEYPFPHGLEDAFKALNWVFFNAEKLGVNAKFLAVGGNSAGGNFASVLAQASSDVVPKLCHQLLLFPVVNYGFDSNSSQEYAEGYFLTKEMMQWCWDAYLQGYSNKYDPLISPLHGCNLKDVCSATIITAEYDILRDDAHAYAQRLKEENVQVTLHCWEESIHDFMLMPDKIPWANEAIIFAADQLKKSFNVK